MVLGLTISITPITEAQATAETKISFDEATPILDYSDQNSYIFHTYQKADGVSYESALCSGWDDPKCWDGSYNAKIIFPFCKNIVDRNCIESLKVTSEKDVDGTAKLIKTLNPNGVPTPIKGGCDTYIATPYSGDGCPEERPGGAGLSLFEVPSLAAGGEVSKFAVRVKMEFSKQKGNGRPDYYKNGDFSATVIPYIDGNTKYKDPYLLDGQVMDIKNKNGDPRCVWSEKGACGLEAKFPKGAKVKLSIRVGNYFTPWLHGRLAEPSFDFTDIDSRQNQLTISAKPVVIPGVIANIPIDENLYLLKSTLCYFNRCDNINQNFQGSDYITAGWTAPFKIFESLEKFVPSRASSTNERWSFRNNPLWTAGMARACVNVKFDSRFLGLIGTNSIVYDLDEPQLRNGFLDYKVGGVHSNPDGSDFMGSYDLVLNGEFARCLFGLSDSDKKVPLSSTISLVSGGLESTVQTTFFNDDGKWVRFGAYDFTFSIPKLRIKLFEKPTTESVKDSLEKKDVNGEVMAAEKEAQTKAMAKKKTITCIKGKLTKKVTGLTPKCPTGYKKK